ncbi:hypothetical protein PULV_a3542 [Pseudoalteromonas ulvae UL12]|uniref:response regulator transcription factor n=1 Tax=Pseudoalteromonas ulvae TaxID=107327 RepID=UPI00186B75F7|nr:response regulator transcription factor [Pseudoalteromonas ulvae]MBE0363347.1 hypothetical protein [Pseudoalteromonas ulvae UL12]
MTSILIIEDDLALNEQISALLAHKGFSVHSEHDGLEGLHVAERQFFNLILLDVKLPRLMGYELLAQLRKTQQTPVIMLTAFGAEEHRIKGLSLGADDYLSKPFNIEELLLRIDAILRRTSAPLPQAHGNAQSDICFNDTQMLAQYRQKHIELTPIQFNLLKTLVKNNKSPLSKQYLYQHVLKREYSQYDRSLDMHLSRVRKKCVQVGMPAHFITTLHGKGYCFNADT